VNLERGTLLSYCNVFLNESPSSDFIASQGVERVAKQDSTTPPLHRDPVIGAPSVNPTPTAFDAIR